MKKLINYKINFIKKNPMLSVGISFIKGVLITLLVMFLMNGCTPVRYVYVDPKDSTIRKQRVIYDNLYIPSPFYFNYQWGSPYYNPIIIQAPLNGYLKKPIIQPNKLNIPLPPRPPRGKR